MVLFRIHKNLSTHPFHPQSLLHKYKTSRSPCFTIIHISLCKGITCLVPSVIHLLVFILILQLPLKGKIHSFYSTGERIPRPRKMPPFFLCTKVGSLYKSHLVNM